MEKLSLPVHEHPLYRVGGNKVHGNLGLRLDCVGCKEEGHIEDGFRCSQCPKFYLHRKCGESALEINHPSHPEHLLKLLVGGPLCRDNRCQLCGVDLELLGYQCSICDFTLDTKCAINPPPLRIIEQPAVHNHPLKLRLPDEDADFTCRVCGDGHGYKFVYSCNPCGFFFHVDCGSLSLEINHPSHPRHLLKLHRGGDSSSGCSLCEQDIKNKICYHCSICNFTLDLRCVKNPPPLALVSPKTHNHQLSLMPRVVSFTCNACGMPGDRSPYVCGQCNFMIHMNCVDLPGVIRINRHDHRISHTYDLDLLGITDLECRVCHRTMDSSYGAYSCLECKNFVVHSRCATEKHCWDGRDLEGEPEEIEDVSPFKVIGKDLIKHFSHEEHGMRLVKEGNAHEGTETCKACIKPIGVAERFYKCTQCDYILHETCANFPRKILTVLFPEKATLVGGVSYYGDTFRCDACKRYSSGFRYTYEPYRAQIDLQCLSITEPLKREAHNHPLYYFSGTKKNCSSCCEESLHGFKCFKDGCDFSLHFKCATFPDTVKHKSDDHTLCLRVSFGRDYDHKYWCDICEKKVDHSKHYYTCDDCGTTMHIKCVLGDLFGSIKPGSIIKHKDYKSGPYKYCHYKFEVVPNIGINRLLCYVCQSRCTFSLALKTHDNHNRYICSCDCLTKIFYSIVAGDHWSSPWFDVLEPLRN